MWRQTQKLQPQVGICYLNLGFTFAIYIYVYIIICHYISLYIIIYYYISLYIIIYHYISLYIIIYPSPHVCLIKVIFIVSPQNGYVVPLGKPGKKHHDVVDHSSMADRRLTPQRFLVAHLEWWWRSVVNGLNGTRPWIFWRWFFIFSIVNPLLGESIGNIYIYVYIYIGGSLSKSMRLAKKKNQRSENYKSMLLLMKYAREHCQP